MTALRALLRLFPLLSAVLLLTAQPLDLRAPAPHETVVVSHEHDVLPPRSGDLVTRKQRHAASLEEFFAIDDDSDQYHKAPPGFAAVLVRTDARHRAGATAALLSRKLFPPTGPAPLRKPDLRTPKASQRATARRSRARYRAARVCLMRASRSSTVRRRRPVVIGGFAI